MKKISKKIFLTNFLKSYFKALPENTFFSKKHFFVFYRNFGFNLEISSYHYSQLKKHLKVDPETRSYDFLTKTREKNPRSGNIRNMKVTLEKRMIGNHDSTILMDFIWHLNSFMSYEDYHVVRKLQYMGNGGGETYPFFPPSVFLKNICDLWSECLHNVS